MEDKQLLHLKDIIDTHLDSHIKHTNKIIKETIKEVVNGKIDRIAAEQKEMRAEMSSYHSEMETRFKPFEIESVENRLVKKIVFGMVGVLLLSVLTALVALVLTK